MIAARSSARAVKALTRPSLSRPGSVRGSGCSVGRPLCIRAVIERTALLGLVACVAVLASAPAAFADRAFSQRFGENARGNATFVANTSVTCAPPPADPNCPAKQAGTLAAGNPTVPAPVDVDSDPTTMNSSRGTLNLPSGATVLFAGLYWGGRPDLTNSGTATIIPTPAEFGQVKVATPAGGGYQTITATEPTDIADFQGNLLVSWQAFADVTSLVQSAGPGEYTVADLRIETTRPTSNGSWGGWTLVVAYSNPADPWRNLSVFDGLVPVMSGGSTVDIPISGFVTPPAPAPVRTTLGVVAYEGDRGFTGDSMRVIQGANQVLLTDGLTPQNDFFNGRISRGGVDAGDRLPAYDNQMGYDAKLIDATNALANNTSSATVRVITGGDGIAPGAITTATELFTPQVTATKQVSNLSQPAPGTAEPGDVLEYTVTVRNQAADPANPVDSATQVVLRDAIPAGVSYVPGSLAMVTGDPPPAGGRSDAAGDDSAEYDGAQEEVVFRLGSGADATGGGTIAPGQEATIRFRVTVDAVPSGTTIVNSGDVDLVAPTIGEPLEEQSNEVSTLVVIPPRSDLAIEKTVSPATVDRGRQVTYALRVTNDGPSATPETTVTDALPAGMTYVSDDSGCNATAPPAISCITGPLASGASTTIRVVARADGMGVLTNTASVTGPNEDTDPTNNTDTAEVDVVQPVSDLALTKTSSAATVEPGATVAWTVTVRNDGPSEATNVVVTDTAPAGMTIASPDASCSGDGAQGRCTMASLPVGESRSFTVTGTAPATTATCFTNRATVAGDQHDPSAANNDASATSCTRPARHDMKMTKTATQNRVTVGDAVTYKLVSKNDGPDAAPDVNVRDTVPPELDVREATTTQGDCDIDGNEVSCTIGTLPARRSATVTVRAVAVRAGTATNVAVVDPPPQQPNPQVEDPRDPPANNTDKATVRIVKPKLRVAKTAARRRVRAGGIVTYAIRVTNPSKAAVRRVRTCDHLPAGLVPLKASPKVRVSKGRYCWTAKRIAAGKSKRYELTVRALPGAAGRTVNRATASSRGVRRTARAAAAVRVLARQTAGGGVTG
jgi:uncharacterized repeat protein (TIGR01451 family)